jgi:hypothetical protein
MRVELAQTQDALVRPWRRATVVASVIAAVELVLLVAAGIALLGRDLARHAQPASAGHEKRASAKAHRIKPALARPEPIGKPKLARAATSVLVLNGNGRAGAAAMEANVVTARGYRLAQVGNAPRTGYTRTVVMYRPGYRAEAARLAHDIGISLFSPLDGLTPAALGSAHLAVVVGED